MIILTACKARSALAMSNAISVGCTSSAIFHALFFELVENGLEAFAKILVAVLDLLRQVRRETVYEMPDADEPVNPLTTPTPKRFAACAVFFNSSAARWRTPSGFAIAVDVVGQDLLVAPVNQIAHRLADEVRADRVALQSVPS